MSPLSVRTAGSMRGICEVRSHPVPPVRDTGPWRPGHPHRNARSMAESSPQRRWWTLAAMCFALFMIMLDNTVVNVALPAIQKDLDPSPANLEWTVNAYVLTFAALILLGGALGDRYG